MEKIQCDNCFKEFNLSNFNKNIHYFYCQKCISKINIISRSNCKKAFMIDDNDLKNLKYIYTENNNYRHYKSDEIELLIIRKYGSLNNLNKILLDKKDINNKKDEKKNNIKENREKEIREIFKLNKIEFKNYGECYSYINYGKPPIESIIENELKKINEKNEKRMKLSRELSKLNISFDETLKPCYEYINNIGTREFSDVIRATEVEHFLKTHTQYEELCKKFDRETAKEIAMRNYAEKIPYNKIKVCFD